jgi:hypothetical protein
MSQPMSEQPKPKSGRRGFRRFGWLGLLALPLGIFSLALIGVGVREWQASRRLEDELARIRAAGLPTDDATMSQWFQQATRTEGTAAWGELLRLAGGSALPSAAFEALPYIGNAQPPTVIEPGGNWPEEPLVTEFLSWMRPVIEQLHDARDYPTPVWQPIEFQGFQTLLEELQESRSLIRLLQVEVEHALHHGEAERALRGLNSMRGVAEAFDWEICLVADLVHRALVGVHQSMILRSLACDLWTEEHLDQLLEQLGPPIEADGKWQRVFAGERAMTASALMNPASQLDLGQGSPFWLLVKLPSQREAWIRAYDAMLAVGEGPLDGLLDRARELEASWQVSRPNGRGSFFDLTRVQVSLFFPALEAYANAFVRSENGRRLARTALAVKKYHLRNGTWPTELQQLEQVGLKASDWRIVSGEPLGYQVDGAVAYVWGPDWQEPQQGKAIRAQPPNLDDEEDRDSGPWALIR